MAFRFPHRIGDRHASNNKKDKDNQIRVEKIRFELLDGRQSLAIVRAFLCVMHLQYFFHDHSGLLRRVQHGKKKLMGSCYTPL